MLKNSYQHNLLLVFSLFVNKMIRNLLTFFVNRVLNPRNMHFFNF